MTADCETLHGVPCDDEALDLPADVDAQLPEGALVQLGQVVELAYTDGETVWGHFFADAQVLFAGPGVLYIVGAFDVTEAGIVDEDSPEGEPDGPE
jgi:hypothetical protein